MHQECLLTAQLYSTPVRVLPASASSTHNLDTAAVAGLTSRAGAVRLCHTVTYSVLYFAVLYNTVLQKASALLHTYTRQALAHNHTISPAYVYTQHRQRDVITATAP